MGTRKGEVAVYSRNGYLSLRWRVDGQRYAIALGLVESDPLSVRLAEQKANAIRLDILSGNFDKTLAKYKPKKVDACTQIVDTPYEIYKRFLDYKAHDISPSTLKKYQGLLDELKTLTPDNVVKKFADLAPETVKRKLEWIAQAYKLAEVENPFEIVLARHKVPPKLTPRPFSVEEVRLILEGFTKYEFHYLPYVQFCLSTGVRVQEARSLKWEQISDDLNRIQILDHKRGKTRSFKLPEMAVIAIRSARLQAFYRCDFNPNAHTRAIADNFKIISRAEFQELLLEDCPAPSLDQYIFKTYEGRQITAGNFRTKHWLPTLKKQGIDYRRPYLCRSTAISHALDKGIKSTDIAQITGHSLETLHRDYAAYIGDAVMVDLF